MKILSFKIERERTRLACSPSRPGEDFDQTVPFGKAKSVLGGVRRDTSHGTRDARAPQAFSLIEILVTVAILSIMILGLVAMFNQTRRAFTTSMTQVDVLEAGRTAADMLAREMEQVMPTSAAGVFNFYVGTPSNVRLVQPLSDPTDMKTNILQQVYFVTRNNMQYNAIGYKLLDSGYGNGIGTLYRFSSNNIYWTNFVMLSNQWLVFTNVQTPGPNFSRIIDGVVDFRVRVYGMNGLLMTNFLSSSMFILTNSATGEYTQADFSNDAVPAYVEVELGVLEDRTLAKYNALTNAGLGLGSPAWNYLTNHAAQVHIFRQRLSIRNVNPAAYP